MFNAIVYAAGPDALDKILYKINTNILNPLIELSFIIALAVFLFGIMEFLRSPDSEEARRKGKLHMLWGTIGLLIMLTVFGLITLLTDTLGITGVTLNQKQQTFEAPPMTDLVLPK